MRGVPGRSSAVLSSASIAPQGPAVDRCEVDSDCVFSEQNGCCGKTGCREDLRAETKESYAKREKACALKECDQAGKRICTRDSKPPSAICKDHECVIAP